MNRTFRDRLFSQLVIDPSGCLLWTGSSSGGGYGQVWDGTRSLYVHRVMYEIFVGPIPEGMQVDHLCRNTACASPAHLEAVTPRENTRRSSNPAAVNAAKTHCNKGHEFDLLNTYWHPTGRRVCRTCTRRRAPVMERAS